MNTLNKVIIIIIPSIMIISLIALNGTLYHFTLNDQGVLSFPTKSQEDDPCAKYGLDPIDEKWDTALTKMEKSINELNKVKAGCP